MIKLFIDSGCNLSEELKNKYDISVLETDLYFNGTTYKSGVTWEYFSPQELYDSMCNGDLPEISQPSIGNWTEQLKSKIKSPEDEIVYIATSSKIAGSLRVFNILMNMNHEILNKLHVIESAFGAPTTEFIILEIAKSLSETTSFEEIQKRVNEINQLIHIYDISETMKNWAFTGRTDITKKLTYPEGIPLIKGMPNGLFVPIGLFNSFEEALNKFSEEMSDFKPNKCVINYAYNTYTNWISDFKKVILNRNKNCEILAEHIASPTATAIHGLNSVNVAFI